MESSVMQNGVLVVPSMLLLGHALDARTLLRSLRAGLLVQMAPRELREARSPLRSLFAKK
jgi:hypothetical protein